MNEELTRLLNEYIAGDTLERVTAVIDNFIYHNYYDFDGVTDLIIIAVNKLYKQIDNLTIETRPISPEQQTKFLFYNMAIEDSLKVLRKYLESVSK